MTEKLCEEQRYGKFNRMERDGNERNGQSDIRKTLQTYVLSIVKSDFNKGKGLEKLLFQFSFFRFWNANHKRYTPKLLRQHVDNERLVAVFDVAQDDGFRS